MAAFSRLVLALVMAFMVAACAHPPAFFAAPRAENFLPLPAETDVRQVAACVDVPLVLELDDHPSTGFAWEVASLPVQLGKPVMDRLATPDAEGRVGAPGRIRLTFPVIAAGQGVLVLAFRRPWEAGIPPARLFVSWVHAS